MANLNFNSSKSLPRNRKIKKFFVLLLFVCGLVYLASIILPTFESDEKIAQINGETIYKKEIADKIANVFGSNNAKIPAIEELPADVIEAFSKEIYLERKIVKKAKKSGVDGKDSVKKLLKQAKNRILIDAYIEDRIAKEITDEAIKMKYAELSAKIQGKKEYEIYHIVLDNEKDASMVYRAYNETYPAQKPRRFSELAKKYSIDKESANNSGKIGYLIEDDIPVEVFQEISSIKNAGYTKPIKTDFGWHIVVVKDVRDAKILPFEESYDDLKNRIIQDTTNEIYEEVFKDVKVKVFLPKKEESQNNDKK